VTNRSPSGSGAKAIMPVGQKCRSILREPIRHAAREGSRFCNATRRSWPCVNAGHTCRRVAKRSRPAAILSRHFSQPSLLRACDLIVAGFDLPWRFRTWRPIVTPWLTIINFPSEQNRIVSALGAISGRYSRATRHTIVLSPHSLRSEKRRRRAIRSLRSGSQPGGQRNR
jgi:hypothetical protein